MVSSSNKIERLRDRYGDKRVAMVGTLLLIGFASVCLQLLVFGKLNQTALLYMLIPYSISLLIALMSPFKRSGEKLSNGKRYLSHIKTAAVVFLGSSIVVREGFICVIFTIPIYFIIVSLAFAVGEIAERRKKKGHKTLSIAAPIIFIALSLEGTSNSLSLSRYNQVEIQRSTSLSVEQIKTNLSKTIDLNKDRHWILRIFPMPYEIEANSLQQGDIHKIKTRYHRWFATNTHEGEAKLLIEEVGENHVRTRILEDTTYFSSYLNLIGTEISLNHNNYGGTNISLTLNYHRNLDPAWYFHPVQKFAMRHMGNFLIEEIMLREN